MAGDLVNDMNDATILRIFDENPGATMNGRVRPRRLLSILDAGQRRHTRV